MRKIAPDGTVGTYSFNHCAFGCVADWFVRYVGGLAPLAPGYREFLVAPHPVGGLRFCRMSYESACGTIRVGWERGEDGHLRVEVEVPAGTRAFVRLPSWENERVISPGMHVPVACLVEGIDELLIDLKIFTWEKASSASSQEKRHLFSRGSTQIRAAPMMDDLLVCER